jgi:biopolymer transport protein ExbD
MAGADVPASGGKKGGRRVSIYIDMTPMVDVIILLLIFFFMTATFKEPDAVEVTLPTAEAGVRIPKDIETISVVVDGSGVVYVNNEPIQAQGDVTRLITEARKEAPMAIINVRAEESVEYGVLQSVMRELQAANALRFNLEVQKEEGAW